MSIIGEFHLYEDLTCFRTIKHFRSSRNDHVENAFKLYILIFLLKKKKSNWAEKVS